MEFRIADTFTDSLARLTGDEQKAVKTTAFDLQLNPANPGIQLHKLERARDKNFWSVRVNRDLRVIVHRSAASLLLCYVAHHDDAYAWAERRKLDVHPTTGAAQLVELRETVLEITIPKAVEAPRPIAIQPPLFARIPESELLGYGVPPEWLGDVRQATESNLLDLVEHLPQEAAEALLSLATGQAPEPRQPAAAGGDPFAHPDAQRRFRVMSNVEELERALDFPWEKWTVFLHPDQRQLVERDYSGPARVSGSAGTGKTIVALHRAVYLARQNPDARVLLTTFSETLANALRRKLRCLIGQEPKLAERLEVHALSAIARRLYERNLGPLRLATPDELHAIIEEAAQAVEGHSFSPAFLRGEWRQVVDAWQLNTWEAYRDVVRLGRKTRLPEKQRLVLWAIFERAREALDARGLVTMAGMYHRLAAHTQSANAPFEFVIVDEAQDVDIAQLRFLAALGQGRPDALFFAGDLGQRIFQQPFSWKSLGVDIRGRSRTLHINYRTSHQIRSMADRLLDAQVSDVDGNTEDRSGNVSIFNGPPPEVVCAPSIDEEIAHVAQWLLGLKTNGSRIEELAVFVRSAAQLDRACLAVARAGLNGRVLDESVEPAAGHVSISTMHLAKGLEFRAVSVMACDDEIIPLQERIDAVSEPAELEETYETERHLLYVACTRARDHLLITSAENPSEFLDDLGTHDEKADRCRLLRN